MKTRVGHCECCVKDSGAVRPRVLMLSSPWLHAGTDKFLMHNLVITRRATTARQSP